MKLTYSSKSLFLIHSSEIHSCLILQLWLFVLLSTFRHWCKSLLLAIDLLRQFFGSGRYRKISWCISRRFSKALRLIVQNKNSFWHCAIPYFGRATSKIVASQAEFALWRVYHCGIRCSIEFGTKHYNCSIEKQNGIVCWKLKHNRSFIWPDKSFFVFIFFQTLPQKFGKMQLMMQSFVKNVKQ